MSGIINGNQGKLQIGQQTDFVTVATPTLALEFVSESLKFVPAYMESNALVGKKTISRMDISGTKVNGDFAFIVHPDNVGLILGFALGSEAAPALHDGGATAYDHAFTLLAGGSANSLPSFTAIVDRLVEIFAYIGLKVSSLKLEAKAKDYLRGTVSVIGYDEQDSASTQSLSYSALKPFRFVDGTVTVDGTDYADVTSVDLTIDNGLEDDLFTMGSGTKMAEIQPQKRKVTGNIEVLYSSTNNTTRQNKFKTGSTASIVLTFATSEEIETGIAYTLEISLPLAYITDASPNIGGPDRIKQTLVVEASEDDTNEAITATLTDAESTAYLS